MHWQYNTLPYLLQFVVALLGCFVAVFDYDRRHRPAPLIVAFVFLFAFLLPFFSDVILRAVPGRIGWVADTLIANNRYGLLFYVVLTVAPWFYFWPRAYVWLTTAPAKPKHKK